MPGHSSPHETEWSLLLAACCDLPAETKAGRIRDLLASHIEWSALHSLAENHGMMPLLAQALLSVEHEIPAEAIKSLKQGYQANLHKALFLSREFVSIVECLSQAGIEFLPYKGLALAEGVYGDIALRQTGDIDLLIHAADLKRVREAVAHLGYMPHHKLSAHEEEFYLRSGYECAFDGPAGKNLLEVQWAIQPRFYAVDLEMEDLFHRGIKATVAGVDVKTLSPEDSFVVLALHAAKHAWGKLIWICDLSRVSRARMLDWKSIANRARVLGIVRILWVTLLLAEKLFNSPVPASARENLPEDAAAETLAEEIKSYVESERIFDVESSTYFKLMIRLRERKSDRIRFLSRLAFTPGPGEWAVARFPKALFPLYRLIRITRLGSRIVSGRI